MESEVLGASLGCSVSHLPAAATADGQTDMGTDRFRLGRVQVNDIEFKLCSFRPGPLWRDPLSFFASQGHTFLLGRLVVKSGGLVFEVVPLGYGLILVDKDSGWGN